MLSRVIECALVMRTASRGANGASSPLAAVVTCGCLHFWDSCWLVMDEGLGRDVVHALTQAPWTAPTPQVSPSVASFLLTYVDERLQSPAPLVSPVSTVSPRISRMARADRRDLDRNAATGASVIRSPRSSSV